MSTLPSVNNVPVWKDRAMVMLSVAVLITVSAPAEFSPTQR